MKNIWFIVFVLSLSFSCKQEGGSKSGQQASLQEYKTLELMSFMSEFLKTNKDSSMLIDLRTPPEFDAGYIKGAVLINFLDDDIEKQLGLLDKSKQYFIYCQQGARSAKCMDKMKSLGFRKVYALDGGYEAYHKASFK
jgi:rhodanese-related sulfurtransferase